MQGFKRVEVLKRYEDITPIYKINHVAAYKRGDNIKNFFSIGNFLNFFTKKKVT